MAYYYDEARYEFEFSAGVWTDVTADVIGTVKGGMGIHGWAHHDRIAEPGELTVILLNRNNEYTPGNINCASGFKSGVHLRMVLKYGAVEKFRYYGTVMPDGIKINTTPYLSYTTVTARDYMQLLDQHELWLPELAQNKSMEEIVALVLANMDIAPLSTSYGTGQETFLTVFDTTKAKTTALSEIAKVTHSEIGYVYLNQGDTSADANAEILVTEGRNERNGMALSQNQDSDDFIFDNSMQSVEVTHGNEYYNQIKAVAYPRRVDAAANVTLFNLESPVAIDPGATVHVYGKYADPDQEAQEVSGIDMVTPLVANTHFMFNTADDGSGTDISADLTITPVFGTNGFDYECTNGNANLGYLTLALAVGKGVYIYRPIESFVEDAALVAADDRRLLTVDMKYQWNPLVADDVAGVLLDMYSDKRTVIEKVTFVANRSEFLLKAFMDLQIGHKVQILADSIGVDAEYIVHAIDWISKPGGFFQFTLWLREAAVDNRQFWLVGEAGFSEIGETTVVGY